MLKAVVLDFDGTVNTSRAYYTRFVEAYLEVVAERLGCSVEEADVQINAFRKQTLSLTMAVRKMGFDADEFYRAVADRIDASRLLTEDARLKNLIATLRNLNLKVAMLTNCGRPLLKKALDALGCPFECFDAVVTSSEVEPKPSLQPFHYTVQLLGCGVEEVVYVGDRVSAELKPAKQAGVKTVLIGGEVSSEEKRWVDWTLKDIYSLPDLLRGIRSS